MAIGLIFRFKLTAAEQIEFETSGKIPDVLIGYSSGRSNPEPGYVQDWLRHLKMPLSKEYVPMFVYNGTKPESLADVRTGVFGQEFEMDPASVLPDLSLVCRIDVQTAAANKKPASWFVDLSPPLPIEQKQIALVEAARSTPRYAEARMYRALRAEDFLLPKK
jgi:hypothetical protein